MRDSKTRELRWAQIDFRKAVVTVGDSKTQAGEGRTIPLNANEGEGKYVQIRGTEPRLTNTTIDGVNLPSPEPGVRQIKFDAIPADLLTSCTQEVNKQQTSCSPPAR